MRYLLGLALFSVSLLAQDTTCVIGPIYAADGGLASGTVQISWPTFFTNANRYVPAGMKTVPIVNGQMNVCLEANDRATPTGSSYRVQFSLYPSVRPPVEYWVIPYSITNLRVDQVRVSGPVTPSVMVGISQILGGGASVGQILAWNGTSWFPQNLTGVSVSSFNGRAGAVVPTTNDYSFSQLSGTLGAAQGVQSFNARLGAVVPTSGDYSFSQLSGTAAVVQGGTGTTAEATPGAVFFAGADGVFTTDSGTFFWNNTSKRLGIGNNSPAYTLDVTGDARATGTFYGTKLWTSQDATGGLGLGRYSAADPSAHLDLLDTSGGSNNPTALLFRFNGIERFRLTQDAKFGIGMIPGVALDVTGQMRASGGILFGDATTLTTATVGGDISGTTASATVGKLQGRTLASTAPTTGYVIKWNGTQWEPQADAVGYSLPDPLGQNNKVLSNNGTVADWRSIGGDISGNPEALTVGKLQGRTMASTAPTNGQVIAWSGSQWEPTTPASGLPAQVGNSSRFLTTDGSSASWSVINSLQGRTIASTAPSSNQVLKWSGTQWAPAADEVGSSIPSVTGNANKILSNDGLSASWVALGGDVSGPPGTTTVGKIQGRTVSSTAPANNQVLVWNNGLSQWEPQDQSGGSITDGSNLGGGTFYWFYQKNGANLEFYSFDVTAPLAASLATNKITFSLPAATGAANGYLTSGDWTIFNNKVATTRSISTGTGLTGGGDLSADRSLSVVADSTTQKVEVAKGGTLIGTRKRINLIEGSNITLTVADDAGGNKVDVTITGEAGGTSGQPNYGTTFSGQTNVTILGSAHGFASTNLLVQCYDNSSPAKMIEPNHITVDSSTFDVVANFASAQSGKCVVNGSGGGSGSSGGGHILQDEGSPLTQRASLNVIGGALAATDDALNDATKITLTQSPADATSVVGTTRQVATGTGLTGGGNLSADRTISVDTTVVPTLSGGQNFTQLRVPNGVAPTGTDCDAANELGKLYIVSPYEVYVCSGASGWIRQPSVATGWTLDSRLVATDGSSGRGMKQIPVQWDSGATTLRISGNLSVGEGDTTNGLIWTLGGAARQTPSGLKLYGGDAATEPAFLTFINPSNAFSLFPCTGGKACFQTGSTQPNNEASTNYLLTKNDPATLVQVNGTDVATERKINIVAGTNVTVSGADDAANSRVNVTVNSTGGGSGNKLVNVVNQDTVLSSGVEATLVTATVPGGTLGTSGCIDVKGVINTPGTGAEKTVRLKLGSSSKDIQTVWSGEWPYKFEWMICNSASQTAQRIVPFYNAKSTLLTDDALPSSLGVDTTIDQTFALSIQCACTDTMTVRLLSASYIK